MLFVLLTALGAWLWRRGASPEPERSLSEIAP